MINPLTTGTTTIDFTYIDPDCVTYTTPYPIPPYETIEDKFNKIIALLEKLVDNK